MEGVIWYLAFELKFLLDQTVRLKKAKSEKKKTKKKPPKTGSREVGAFELLVFGLKNVSKLGRDFIES